MAEVSAAAAAVDLGARHAVAPINGCAYRSLERGEKAGPAGTALELAAGGEQRLPAAGTAERAGALLLEQRAGPGRLGAVAAQHGVLLRRQRAAPLLVSLFNWILHHLSRRVRCAEPGLRTPICTRRVRCAEPGLRPPICTRRVRCAEPGLRPPICTRRVRCAEPGLRPPICTRRVRCAE